MTYCELWLESEGGMSSLRVALLVPAEFEIPDVFTLSESQMDPDKKLYYSEILDGIINAKKAICHDITIFFLYFSSEVKFNSLYVKNIVIVVQMRVIIDSINGKIVLVSNHI